MIYSNDLKKTALVAGPELVFSSTAMKQKLDSIIKTTSHQPEIMIFEDMEDKAGGEALPVNPTRKYG